MGINKSFVLIQETTYFLIKTVEKVKPQPQVISVDKIMRKRSGPPGKLHNQLKLKL